MDMQRKAFRAPEFKAIDRQAGIIEAIVAVFGNVDMGDERIMPGAFAESLTKRTPKGVWAHDWQQPVAKTLEARELLPGDPLLPASISANGGLYIKGQFNLDTQRGKDAFSDIAFGLVDEFSIGYSVLKYAEDEETDVTDLLKVDLYEWSPVVAGMNPATALLSAKGPVPGLGLDAHVDAVVSAASELGARFAANAAGRAKDGRSLSDANAVRIARAADGLQATIDALKGLTVPAPAPVDETDARAAYGRYLELTALGN